MDDMIVTSGPIYEQGDDGVIRELPPGAARWYGGYDTWRPEVGHKTFVPARWRRLARWWFDARCWIAEHVLRVPAGDDW